MKSSVPPHLAMKYMWTLVALFVLLGTVSNQEDLTEEELGEQPSREDSTPEEESSFPPFRPPEKPSGNVYFAEAFTDPDEVWKVWIPSQATKDGADSEVAKYDGEALAHYLTLPHYQPLFVIAGEWKLASPSTEGGIDEDQGLILSVSYF